MTSGISVITAKPSASTFRASPGPDVVVHARFPPSAAPIAEHIPPISSSAWRCLTPYFLNPLRKCSISVAGVIGYEPRNSGILASRAAVTSPSAAASLPVIFR